MYVQIIENLKRSQKNSGAEKYNNRNEKFFRGIQKQIFMEEKRINKFEGRTMGIIESEEQKKRIEEK